MNDCIDSGTQLPYILRAKAMGFAVLVLNTNQNQSNVPSKFKDESHQLTKKEGHDEEEVEEEEVKEKKLGYIRGSRSPHEHGEYVFENLVMENQNLERIFVVAHR